jgi:hypothetical protein
VIDPPDPTCTYLPTSAVANVYDPVFVPTAGAFRYPSVAVLCGSVYTYVDAAAGGLSVAVPELEPLILTPLLNVVT